MLILAAVSGLAAVAWLYLLAGHGGYWRTGQRLPHVPAGASIPGPDGWPAVSVIVPARDEAAMLPVTLPTLLGQDYPGDIDVVLVDDGSCDGTAEVARQLGRDACPGRWGSPGRRTLLVVSGTAPPDGWAGKVWAMAQGVARAGQPRYLLFTDADIACRPSVLTSLVTAAEHDDRVLVSQMALLRAESFWERVLVPAFVYFFAQLYPFRRVNRAGSRTAAAAGGCMLVRRRALDAGPGLAGIAGARIDDVALSRMLKRRPAAGRCWLGLSTDVTSVRPYPGLATLWHLIARSAYTQLRYSPVLLAGTIAGLLWLYALPPAAALAGLAAVTAGAGQAAAWCAAAGLAGWLVMAVSFLPILRLYRLSALRAPGLPLIALLYAAMTVDSARRHHGGRGGEWKGRVSPAAATRSQPRGSGRSR